MAEAIRDADIGDDTFGQGSSRIDHVLVGWSSQDLPYNDLLTRGIDLIDGLYRSLKQ
jgi:hypothetical protein